MAAFEYIKYGEGSKAETIAKELRTEKFVSLDTETTGLDPHVNKVTLMSLSTQDGRAFVVDTRDTKNLIAFKDFFEDEAVKKIGFNLDFDYKMIKGTAGADLEGLLCLYQAENCLTAGKEGYFQKGMKTLAAVTERYLGKTRDKTLQTSFVGHTGEFSQEQLQYAADDVLDLPALAKVMKQHMLSEGVTQPWLIECNAISSFADINYYGQKIDEKKWRDIMASQEIQATEAKKELDSFFIQVVGTTLFGDVDINYDSQPQLLYGLKMLGILVDGKTISNTNKETQKKIRHLPVIQALEKYRKAVKALGTYGETYLTATHPMTGRIHPKLFQYGTETGRPACGEGLNVLNIPRDKRYRHAFVTDLDRMISTVDFSGAELRIMADLSGDPLMCDAFNRGVDVHCYVAGKMFKKENVQKSDPLRTPAKTINFGLLNAA